MNLKEEQKKYLEILSDEEYLIAVLNGTLKCDEEAMKRLIKMVLVK